MKPLRLHIHTFRDKDGRAVCQCEIQYYSHRFFGGRIEGTRDLAVLLRAEADRLDEEHRQLIDQKTLKRYQQFNPFPITTTKRK